jgi:hypothetical protein
MNNDASWIPNEAYFDIYARWLKVVEMLALLTIKAIIGTSDLQRGIDNSIGLTCGHILLLDEGRNNLNCEHAIIPDTQLNRNCGPIQYEKVRIQTLNEEFNLWIPDSPLGSRQMSGA